MPNITFIPAVKKVKTNNLRPEAVKRRVAGYARVSTDHEEQQSSYEAQVDYYTNYIRSRDDWEFAGIYTDEGISATNTKHREGFNQMVEDALAGKIDLVITKSVSRFARNTVDSLTTVRKLKEKGVEIYFEKENIWTLDAKGELLITIMSSLAQEESRNISENTTWGKRKSFADGKVSLAYSNFLGYDKGPDGNFVINKDQAKIVRMIYRLFLSGYSFHSIGRTLEQSKIKSPGGSDRWSTTTIRSILTNEKYKGDALLQKKYTVDFLTKKQKINEGEIPQYYVEGHHEPIISKEIFEQVQAEIRFRSQNGHSGVSIFSGKIKCGECGSWYGAKVWHSNDKYRKVVYRCNKKYSGDKICRAPYVTENEITAAFIHSVNTLLEEREEIADNIRWICETMCDNSKLEKRAKEKRKKLEVLSQMMEARITENARTTQNQDEYQSSYDELVEEYETIRTQLIQVLDQIAFNRGREETLMAFAEAVQKQDVVTEFSIPLWACLVDFITVYSKDDIRVTFKDGTEI